MKDFKLSAVSRLTATKGETKRRRAHGKTPAVFYGRDRQTEQLTIDVIDLQAILNQTESEHVLLTLDLDGREELAIVRDVQHHPVRGDILHVDFQHVEAGVPLNVSVPVRVEGTPVGVREGGGVLQWSIRSLEVKCLPRNIPEHLAIDVTNLQIGDSVHVEDLSFENVELLDEPRRTVITVLHPVLVKEPEPEEVPVEGEEAEAEEAATEAPIAGEDEKKEHSA
jgi:large subunit ribosomal protein L25